MAIAGTNSPLLNSHGIVDVPEAVYKPCSIHQDHLVLTQLPPRKTSVVRRLIFSGYCSILLLLFLVIIYKIIPRNHSITQTTTTVNYYTSTITFQDRISDRTTSPRIFNVTSESTPSPRDVKMVTTELTPVLNDSGTYNSTQKTNEIWSTERPQVVTVTQPSPPVQKYTETTIQDIETATPDEAVMTTTENAHDSVCDSAECHRYADHLAQTMDTTVNPCDDFYRFTCGRWPRVHPIPVDSVVENWFTAGTDRFEKRLQAFLEQSNSRDDPIPVRQSRSVYAACMNTGKLDQLGMEPLFQVLEALELPRIPHLITGKGSYGFDWIKSVTKIRRALGENVLVSFGILPNPENSTRNYITLGFPYHANRYTSLNPRDSDSQVLKDVVGDMNKRIRRRRNTKRMLDPEYKKAVLQAILRSTTYGFLHYRQINRAIRSFTKTREDIVALNQFPVVKRFFYMPLNELENATKQYLKSKRLPNKSIWRPYLQEMFRGLDVPWDRDGFDNISMNADDLEYMLRFAVYLNDVSVSELELYVWWSVVDVLIRYTTTKMRTLWEDLSDYMVYDSSQRSQYCTKTVKKLMGMAASYVSIDQNFLTTTKPKVQQMVDDIKIAFKERLQDLNWMDETTKNASMEKAEQMKSLIGFPDWLLNRTRLEDYYNGLMVSSDRHLQNRVNLLKYEIEREFKRVTDPNVPHWITTPTEVNAYHVLRWNSILIPIGVLQYPFYNLGLEVLNYATIGSILGHELTHGFDNTGRYYDKNGYNVQWWWNNETMEEYSNHTKCFINQYDSYYISDVNKYVNGTLTLDENIADNGGIAEAFRAYETYVERNGAELPLPGYTKYTMSQLFFIAYGQLWCASTTPAHLENRLTLMHSPLQTRVRGAIANIPQFADAFECAKGSRMNPRRDRCRIW